MPSALKELVQLFLSERPHKAGETVQFGWLWFRVVKEGSPPEVESLDMKRMASFTTDFSEAERILRQQNEVTNRYGVEPDACSLMHTAMVSTSYRPGHPDAFLKHDAPSGDRDSGWYVGVYNDPIDLDDADSFQLQSLYELTINDMRTASYWTLPQGFLVHLNSGRVERVAA